MANRRRAIVATRLYPPEVSAASFRMAALAEALGEDMDVTVLTTRPPADLASTSGAGRIRVQRMPVLRDRSGAIRGYLQYLSFDIPLLLRLLVHRGDVVIAEAPPTTGVVSAVVAALTRTPFVYYPGDVWSDAVASTDAPRLVGTVMRAMERFVLRRAACALAVSPEVGERLRELGARPERVVEVGNGIDTARFHPSVEPPVTERPYFVYTGTMSEWQQPDIFIRALAELGDADVELRFFGQGSIEGDLRRLAETLVPGRVHFGGLIPPAEAASWIRGSVAALVSIVPGIGYDFARPTKTYAAAAVGTPVLFAGASTGAQVIRDAGLGEATGFSVAEVAAAMRRLIEAAEDGTTERERERRAAWAVSEVSLQTIGRRAADRIRAALRGADGSHK